LEAAIYEAKMCFPLKCDSSFNLMVLLQIYKIQTNPHIQHRQSIRMDKMTAHRLMGNRWLHTNTSEKSERLNEDRNGGREGRATKSRGSRGGVRRNDRISVS